MLDTLRGFPEGIVEGEIKTREKIQDTGYPISVKDGRGHSTHRAVLHPVVLFRVSFVSLARF